MNKLNYRIITQCGSYQATSNKIFYGMTPEELKENIKKGLEDIPNMVEAYAVGLDNTKSDWEFLHGPVKDDAYKFADSFDNQLESRQLPPLKERWIDALENPLFYLSLLALVFLYIAMS